MWLQGSKKPPEVIGGEGLTVGVKVTEGGGEDWWTVLEVAHAYVAIAAQQAPCLSSNVAVVNTPSPLAAWGGGFANTTRLSLLCQDLVVVLRS